MSNSGDGAPAAGADGKPEEKRQSNILQKVANPFENAAPWTSYEYLKAFILLPTLFPIRLLVCLLTLILQAIVARITVIGAPMINDRGCIRHEKEFGVWRTFVRTPMVLTNRLLLWSLGFWSINIVDRRKKPKTKANILVGAPHMNLTDPFVLSWALRSIPSGVGMAETLQMPVMSHTLVAAQTIFVDRKNPESKQACKEAIAFRADPGNWKGAPVMIFPEGTVTNGKTLIQFKLGPFAPGQPVQPVVVQYPARHFNFTWVGRNSSMGMNILRMMLQFTNFCTVTFLEPYVPSAEQRDNSMLFASNVRAFMAKDLGIGTTEHTYDDTWFSWEATKGNVSSDFELGQVKELYNMDLGGLKVLLKRFKDFDQTGSGTLSIREFEAALRLNEDGRTEASIQRFFSFFDTDGTGQISYREFVQGLALLSGKCSVESQAMLAFLAFDMEGTGRAQVEALKNALDNSVASGADVSPGEEILESSSVEGKTELSFEEFTTLVNKKPLILQRALELAKQRVGITFEEASAQAVEEKHKKNSKLKKDD